MRKLVRLLGFCYREVRSWVINVKPVDKKIHWNVNHVNHLMMMVMHTAAGLPCFSSRFGSVGDIGYWSSKKKVFGTIAVQ
ncbi:hypothetical protein RYX36_033461 [Vicia faba]